MTTLLRYVTCQSITCGQQKRPIIGAADQTPDHHFSSTGLTVGKEKCHTAGVAGMGGMEGRRTPKKALCGGR